jgi:hypothetical protein
MLRKAKKPAKSTTAVAPAERQPTAREQHLASLDRGVQLRSKLEDITAEELGWKGERPDAEVVQLIQARQQAAEALALTGELPPAGTKRKRTFSDVLRDRRAIERAIEINNERTEQFRLRAAGERAFEKRDDIAAIGRQMCLSLFALDRTMRARDALTREIALPPASFQFEGWPLAGRLHNTGSQLYRFCEMAVEQGWISQRELDEEFDAARAVYNN